VGPGGEMDGQKGEKRNQRGTEPGSVSQCQKRLESSQPLNAGAGGSLRKMFKHIKPRESTRYGKRGKEIETWEKPTTFPKVEPPVNRNGHKLM